MTYVGMLERGERNLPAAPCFGWPGRTRSALPIWWGSCD